MQKLRVLQPSKSELPLVYHGTSLSNMDSICRRGLLIPNPCTNGVGVAHGTSMGLGIYSSTDTLVSIGYSTATTIFVWAAIATNASANSYPPAPHAEACAIVSGNYVVLMQEERICPLFLLDSEYSQRYTRINAFDTRRESPSSSSTIARRRRSTSINRVRCQSHVVIHCAYLHEFESTSVANAPSAGGIRPRGATWDQIEICRSR
jgi:hypothetical protein